MLNDAGALVDIAKSELGRGRGVEIASGGTLSEIKDIELLAESLIKIEWRDLSGLGIYSIIPFSKISQMRIGKERV